jgi:hypothetical protein
MENRMKKKEAPWWVKPGIRHRLEACRVPPMRLELPAERTVMVTYAELLEHVGGDEVAAVLCVAGTFTSVQSGGNSMPSATKLYTRVPQVVLLWPGDSLEFHAVKTGEVCLLAMRPLLE